MKVKIIDIHPQDSFYKHPDKDKILGSIGNATILEKSVVDKDYLSIDFKLDNPKGIQYGNTVFFFIAVKIEKITKK